MVQQDPRPQDNAERQQQIATLSAALRSKYSDYDRWTVADMSRLNEYEVGMFRRIFARRAQTEDISALIPQSIRQQHGERAEGVFMRGVFIRMAGQGTFGGHAEALLRGYLANNLNLSDAQIDGLVLNRPFPMEVRDNATGRISTINVTPAQALSQEINRAIVYPQVREGEVFDPYSTKVYIPTSVIEALIAHNPQLPQISRLRPNPGWIRINPADAYDAGVVAQLRGAAPFGDWGRQLQTNVRSEQCPNLSNVEVNVYDREPNDVTMADAWQTGNLRMNDVIRIVRSMENGSRPPVTCPDDEVVVPLIARQGGHSLPPQDGIQRANAPVRVIG